jgi:tRNA(fMet)-specific endonuclease VapC
MLQFLLDTDHLTLLERSHPPLLQRMGQQPPGAIGVSAVTAEEALRGRLGYLARPLRGASLVRAYALLIGTIQLLNQLPTVPFDDPAEAAWQQLRAQRLRVGTQDLKIAAIALGNSLIVLTRNRRDFGQIPGISLDDWSV